MGFRLKLKVGPVKLFIGKCGRLTVNVSSEDLLIKFTAAEEKKFLKVFAMIVGSLIILLFTFIAVILFVVFHLLVSFFIIFHTDLFLFVNFSIISS